MKIVKAIVLVACTLTMAGCESLGRRARVDPTVAAIYAQQEKPCAYVAGLSKDDKAFAIDLGCYSIPTTSGGIETNAYRAAIGDELIRNRLQDRLVDHSNAICEIEVGKMQAAETTTGLLGDFVASTTSITSTIVGGEQAKSILSGISSLATSTRSSISENVYRGQIIPAIVKIIRNDRATKLTNLEKLKEKPDPDYSVDEMVRRVNEYHQSCSFGNALAILLDAAVNKAGYDRIIKKINQDSEFQTILARREKLLAKTTLTNADDEIVQLDKKLSDLSLGLDDDTDTSSPVILPDISQ